MVSFVFSGFTVFAGVRKASDGEGVIAECKAQQGESVCSRVLPVILDVTNHETIESTFATVSAWTQANGEPFVALVNNAGISTAGAVECTPLQKYRDGLAPHSVCIYPLIFVKY